VIAEVAELKRIRLDEDLLLSELEQQLGIDQTTLSRMFNDGNYRPMERTLHKIRRYLDDRRAAQPVRRARA
jgi:transcriptional regulator with XRE-family HTH domain